MAQLLNKARELYIIIELLSNFQIFKLIKLWQNNCFSKLMPVIK
jgi:hypothetical protein